MRAAPITALLAASLAVTACGTSAQHEGQVLVQQSCGSCHAISPGDLSPVSLPPTCTSCIRPEPQIVDAVEHGAPGDAAGLARRRATSTAIVNYVLQETAR